jgi:tyrosyl-tRNA synthetase
MDSAPSTPGETAAWLARNAVDCLPAGGLERKLALGRPLRVKLGIDPTAPDIHLGFTVVLQKLREFQDLGHTVVLIVGDYTARVGDPSGRSATRPVLDPAEIDANARTFQDQALAVLDAELLEVRFNSEWLDMSMAELFTLLRTATVAQILERDDFAKRFAAREPISTLELLYPLLQGYDSVAVHADVELGGTDQKFNLLLGRDIQRAYGQAEQVILTVPLLTGTDGERKMSKSFENYIGVTEPADEMYGKTLSIPDSSLHTWYSLLLGSGAPDDLPPRDAKRALARSLVERFHGAEAAQAAEAAFDRMHVPGKKDLPDEVPVVPWPRSESMVHLPALLAAAFGISTSEARRVLGQGGVKLDGTPVSNGSLDVPAAEIDGKVLQLGKRRFARVQVGE